MSLYSGLTLTVVDNSDGTATATVGGTGVTDTVKLWYSAFNGLFQSETMTLYGSRTGDGTISVTTLPAGLYVWQASQETGATLDGASYPVYQGIASTTDPVYKQVLDAVVATVQSLNLNGIASASVFARWMPREWDVTDPLPACLVAAVGTEQDDSILISKDDIGYPVAVVLADRFNADNKSGLAQRLLWRQRVRKAFIAQRLQNVPSVLWGHYLPSVVFDMGTASKNLFASFLMFKFTSREPRGLT